jgi:hypothetical protein
VAIVLAGILGVGAASPAQANPDLRFEADVTYELQPDDERVRVSMEISLTNLRPDQGLRYYYFDSIFVPVPTEATNIHAERIGGATLSTSTEALDDPLWSALSVRLSPTLRYGSPQRIQLRYDLPSLAPRSDGWTRASPAYTLFPIYPVGDPGLASITVIVPDVYDDVHLGGSEMTEVESDGEVRYEASSIDTDEWWAVLSARNDSLLDEREFQVGDQTVRLRYWPGDDEWADFVEEMVADGIPVLEELIGRPWPKAGEDLEVIESSAPHAYGYGGWYDHEDNVIEVGDELNALLVLHELSHAWFNRETVAETWLREGLSDLYAYHGVLALDGHEPDREPSPSKVKETVPLAQWTQVIVDQGEIEQYGYETSWWILHQLYEDVGPESMSEILGAAFDRLIPYQAGDQRVETSGEINWMRMLDLLEEIGESEVAIDLYHDHVVHDDHRDLLADRQDAREAYGELVAAADGWDAPLQLRRAMASWQFDQVAGLIATTEEILAQRDDILAGLASMDVRELPALEVAYQGDARLVDTIAAAEQYLEVVAVMREARDRPGGALGPLSWIGIKAMASEGDLTEAADLLATGDVDAAAVISDRVRRDAAHSALIGGLLTAQVLLCLLLLAVTRWNRRTTRRRAGRRTVSSDPWPTDEPYSSPSTL